MVRAETGRWQETDLERRECFYEDGVYRQGLSAVVFSLDLDHE